MIPMFFTARPTFPTRLTLDDLELLVAATKQQASDGNETTCRIAQALESVLQSRRAGVRVGTISGLPRRVAGTCRRRLQTAAGRCWLEINAPLFRWGRSPATAHNHS